MSGIITFDTVAGFAAFVAVALMFRRDPARSLMASGISIMCHAAAWLRRQGNGH